VNRLAKKAKDKRSKKALKPKDLPTRGEAAKLKGGVVGPCDRKLR